MWVGKGNADGTFQINNVPAGNYMITWWDEPQNRIIANINVTVGSGQVIDMGVLPLNGWWTKLDGYVFNDSNRNGVKDPGEAGVPNFTLTLRRARQLADGSRHHDGGHRSGRLLHVRGCVSSDGLGGGRSVRRRLLHDGRHLPGGQPGNADHGQGARASTSACCRSSAWPGSMDWGVHKYDPAGATCSPVGSYSNCLDPRNGGIVGTVSYDTTRNETDPQYAAVEDWQPGISDLLVNLYATVACAQGAVRPDRALPAKHDGSYARGPLLNTYVTETWERPTGCVARDIDGNPLQHGIDEQALPLDAMPAASKGP